MSETFALSDDSDRKLVGRYTTVGVLGRGGQADVFRGVHPTLPIEVAIKLTRTTLSVKMREALTEEAHILCDLDHPNIARIRDFDFDDGRPFMVLNLIRGCSPGQIVKSQPFSPELAAALVAKLAHATDYAHARGVIHRDLKPDNVVIDESGEPKIIDFGMSQVRDGLAGDVEQAVGITSHTDHRVDIFALGAILHRLLVGRSPYPAMPINQSIQQVREGNLMGDFQRAEPLMRKAMEIRKAVFGEQHADYANSVNNLGSVPKRVVQGFRGTARCKPF